MRTLPPSALIVPVFVTAPLRLSVPACTSMVPVLATAALMVLLAA
jgi:hypothetical protein